MPGGVSADDRYKTREGGVSCSCQGSELALPEGIDGDLDRGGVRLTRRQHFRRYSSRADVPDNVPESHTR